MSKALFESQNTVIFKFRPLKHFVWKRWLLGESSSRNSPDSLTVAVLSYLIENESLRPTSLDTLVWPRWQKQDQGPNRIPTALIWLETNMSDVAGIDQVRKQIKVQEYNIPVHSTEVLQ